MVEQILLSSSSFEGVRETGGFGQPLHALYPQIRAVLASELGPEAAGLLAEPVVDRAHNRIDWYTEGDPDHPPVALSDLPEDQRQPILAEIRDFLERGREVAERYAVSGDPRREQWGAMLRAALGLPAETGVFLVEGRPIIIGWGFGPDRPWETLAAGLVPPPAASMSAPVAPPCDVVVPDIAMPELTTATAPESVVESPPLTESPLPIPASEPVSEEPLPELPPALPVESASVPPTPDPESKPPLASKPAPAVGALESSLEPESGPDSGLRYVVIGSRYFWGVVALAILLVVAAVAWIGMGKPSPYSRAGETAPGTDAELDRALTQAQRTEMELRTQLERLLVQLAGQRGQCPSPAAGLDAAPVAPVAQQPGGSHAVPARSTVAVAAGESPREPAIKAPAADGVAIAPDKPLIADRVVVLAGEAPAADRTAVLPTEASVSPDRAMPPAATPPSSSAASPPDTSPLPAKPVSRPPSGMESPARTLEDVLVGRTPAAAAPLPPPARTELPVKAEPPDRVEPPVKAEPTPEERREFASRMSATGAATGEITATLLWNSPGDLDLLVRCPSGQQLDYRNPAACGGALDVDANAARASLSDRPVENAFWSAGQAAPGSYEITVRYAPRKDEQNPRETPFQVRLSRGGQEAVFKGTVRPNAVTPVTTFTVER